MRLSPNLSMLFTERPFLDRFAAARSAGFADVECQLPYEVTSTQLAAAVKEQDQQLVMFNLPAGDWGGGDRGIACDPDRVDEFGRALDVGLEYASAVGCHQLVCLAGRLRDDIVVEKQHETLRSNLARASQACADEDVTLLVEPVNLADVPRFALPGVDQVAAALDEIGDDRIRISFDVYHVQRSHGDVVNRLRRFFDRVGHVQIADNPGRHQPGTGELNFPFILGELDRLGYQGHVGLEYVPDPDTEQSLGWLGELPTSTRPEERS